MTLLESRSCTKAFSLIPSCLAAFFSPSRRIYDFARVILCNTVQTSNIYPSQTIKEVMKRRTFVLGLSLGAIITLTALVGASTVFASSNSYNCNNLAPTKSCGQSYSAWSFSSDVTSNSASQTICAGYVISGTTYCTAVTTGFGAGFTGSSSVSFSSYYDNAGSSTTSIGVTDTYCNCN